MYVAIVTSYPPSKVTLNEYGYYLVKNFVPIEDITKITVYCDETKEEKVVDYETQGKVEFKESWSFNSYYNLFRLLFTIGKDNPDVVLINGQFMKFGSKKIPAALGLMIGFFLKLIGIPSVFLTHNILEKVDLSKTGFEGSSIQLKVYNFIGELLTKIILQSSLVVVTIEDYLELLQKKYQKENISMIPHGTFEVLPMPEDRKLESHKILTFGKFGTYKKVEPMIEAIAILKQKNPELEIKAVIAGTDNPNVPGYLASVQEKYAQYPWIEYTGYVEENEVADLFYDSSVVVFPYTTTTGSSGVLHQAGSYGRAVILPKIDDLAYLIEKEGYEGVYFEPSNAESLSIAIEKVIMDPTYRRYLEEKNYEAANILPMTEVCKCYHLNFQSLTQQLKIESPLKPTLLIE